MKIGDLVKIPASPGLERQGWWARVGFIGKDVGNIDVIVCVFYTGTKGRLDEPDYYTAFPTHLLKDAETAPGFDPVAGEHMKPEHFKLLTLRTEPYRRPIPHRSTTMR